MKRFQSVEAKVGVPFSSKQRSQGENSRGGGPRPSNSQRHIVRANNPLQQVNINGGEGPIRAVAQIQMESMVNKGSGKGSQMEYRQENARKITQLPSPKIM